MEIFKIKNVTFTYPKQEKPVLESINLSIKQGEFVVVFGESGSGKTTLLKMLKRELTPHGKKTGEIYYKGNKLGALDDRTAASKIGYVMQHPETQIVTDKVWNELAFGLENIGIPTSIIRSKVAEIANFFGIHPWFRKKTTKLSGGQKQLLNLASVMVMQPDVLLLDEPTAQLDPIAATNFIATLKKLNSDLGLTIILVEHRLEEVLPLADNVVLLEKGRIIITEKPSEFGKYLKQLDQEHPMLHALPTPMKVFYGLDTDGKSPLTIKEGRDFLSIHYKDDIQALPIMEKNEESEIVIELKNAWFRYERDLPDILSGVNLHIHRGEIISILGGNGSGKTTLLQVISGQNRTYRGNVLINHKKIQKYKGNELYKHNIAVLPQDPQTVFLKATLREDYKEIANVLNYTTKELDRLTDEIATKLEITHLLDQHPYDISGGEQQICALGKILLLQPKILLLDEPTKGIDAFSKQTLLTILKELKRQGLTIIIVTHDVEFAAMISDRVGLFFDGGIISMDSPVEFFSSNNYYTTAASRMSRHLYANTITYKDIISICKQNGEKIYEKTMD
ncbi:ABC transporter ATP-binding protein [Pseudogracilibacillus sp. SO30301A]|uniref:ABC transporter ATP-binding protein n=1 Tax=Pseudogracilibacillus sp. SO30301A TaxID=3098291 RepID=UPI00300E5BBC